MLLLLLVATSICSVGTIVVVGTSGGAGWGRGTGITCVVGLKAHHYCTQWFVQWTTCVIYVLCVFLNVAITENDLEKSIGKM